MAAALISRLLYFLALSALASGNTTVVDHPSVTTPSPASAENLTNKLLTAILDFMRNQTCGGVCCPFPYTNVLQECFFLSQHASTWWDARKHCLGIMGDLAVPKRLYALKDFIYKSAGDLEVFVGGQDEFRNGNFRWLDGTPVSKSDWAPGEPNNFGNKEFCAAFFAIKQTMLIDMICSNNLRFVCQYHFPK